MILISFDEEYRDIIEKEVLPALNKKKQQIINDFNKVKPWLSEYFNLPETEDSSLFKSYSDLVNMSNPGEVGRMNGIVSGYLTNRVNNIIQQNLPDWRTEEAEGYDSVFSASNGKEYPFELKMSFCFERDIRGKKKKNKGWTGNGCSEKVGCYLLIQCSLDEYLPLNKKDGILIKDLWLGFVPIDGVKSKRGKGKSDRTSLNILSCSEIITEGSVHTTNTYLYPKF